MSGGDLLDVDALAVEFRYGRRSTFRAVDGVSLRISEQETVGLVGESGSGKTTVARAILGLTPVASGTVRFQGADISHASRRQRRVFSKDLQVVFQNPYSSLNPARTIGQTLSETLRAQSSLRNLDVRQEVKEMLERVSLPGRVADDYPAQFSGGQRQRIAIARALITRPQMVICDEATSALDLSVQAHVLNLLRDLQSELKLSYLFISHDLAVVRNLSQRIVVLYHGQVMEQGYASDVYESPVHPYTRALLDAAPVPDPRAQQRRRLDRTRELVAVRTDTSAGCPFAARCPHAVDVCRAERPPLEASRPKGLVACHRWKEIQ